MGGSPQCLRRWASFLEAFVARQTLGLILLVTGSERDRMHLFLRRNGNLPVLQPLAPDRGLRFRIRVAPSGPSHGLLNFVYQACSFLRPAGSASPLSYLALSGTSPVSGRWLLIGTSGSSARLRLCEFRLVSISSTPVRDYFMFGLDAVEDFGAGVFALALLSVQTCGSGR